MTPTGHVERQRSPGYKRNHMDPILRKYTSFEEMKADEYRYWQSRPVHERMSAVAELTLSAYAMKEPARDARRIQRTLVCFERPQR